MIRCHDRSLDRAHHRAPSARVTSRYSRIRRLLSVLLPLLMPLLAHAKPLITPATPPPGSPTPATTESLISPEGQQATAREAGTITKGDPSRSLKPVSPQAPDKSRALAPSAPTPGLYLSGNDEPGGLRSVYRFKGLLPPTSVAGVVAKAVATPAPAPASRQAQRDSRVNLASVPAVRANQRAVEKVSASRVSDQNAAPPDGSQADDSCVRTQDGTLVIRTGRANSPCSGADFRAQMSRQLKAAMADIDATTPRASGAAMASPGAWHHVSLTAPPLSMSVIARAPGEDNLRRLNAKTSWVEQYQSRMAEIRIGQ